MKNTSMGPAPPRHQLRFQTMMSVTRWMQTTMATMERMSRAIRLDMHRQSRSKKIKESVTKCMQMVYIDDTDPHTMSGRRHGLLLVSPNSSYFS